MRYTSIACFAGILSWTVLAGCAEVSRVAGSTWHEKCGWKAEDYFEDPQVIALCRAIEANDIAEIDRLVAAGADVNAQGKGNMTPLLWAFPDNKLERFKRLLEHGANPNVVIDSDFNTRGGMSRGDSVTHMACKTAFPGYFEAVFEHGGDANLIQDGIISNQTPIFTLLAGAAPNKQAKVKLLIEKGAHLDHMDGGWATPALMAVGRGGQYDIALMLLKAGANHLIYIPRSNTRLIHNVIEQERLSATWTPQQRADYKKLVKWLEDHGESVEAANADIKRWASWDHASGEYRRKMDAEIAAREARQARERAAAEKRELQDE
jgi:ankyrin repeat protein